MISSPIGANDYEITLTVGIIVCKRCVNCSKMIIKSDVIFCYRWYKLDHTVLHIVFSCQSKIDCIKSSEIN